MLDNVLLNEKERIDDLLTSNLKIIQHQDEFCFSVDAVLLSHFATLRRRYNCLDLGCGMGILPLLLAKKVNHITGLELNERTYSIARRNVVLNNLEDKINIIHGDLKNIEDHIKKSSMDLVITNPPYRQINQGRINLKEGIAMARHEIFANLYDVIKAAAFALKPQGRLAMVHLPERLQEILVLFDKFNLKGKKIQFVQPKEHIHPNILLIEAVKGGKDGGLVTLPTLNIHKNNGEYTETLIKYYYEEEK